MRARSNIYRCRYIARVIWKSPDLPLTRIYTYIRMRVHQKRHGPNFVSRRARWLTVAHKIRRHESITRRGTYLSGGYWKLQWKRKNYWQLVHWKWILVISERKYWGRDKIVFLHLYLHNLLPVTVLFFLIIFSNIEYARKSVPEMMVLRNFRLSFFVRSRTNAFLYFNAAYIHLQNMCNNKPRIYIYIYMFRSIISLYLYNSHGVGNARG